MQNRFYPFITSELGQYVFSAAKILGNGLYYLTSSTLVTVSSYTAKIASPLYSPIEKYVFGDMRNYLKDMKGYMTKLVETARKNSDGIAMVHFGLAFGTVAVWIPQNEQDLKTVVNTLDKEKDGRKIHRTFKFFSGTKEIFFANTNGTARKHRQSLVTRVVPSEYNQKFISNEVNRVIPTNISSTVMLKESISGIIFNIIAKKILGIDTLPKETYSTINSFERDINLTAGFPMPWLFKFNPTLRKQRALYEGFEKTVLDGQLTSILKSMQEEASPAKKNLILSILINLIKKDHPKWNEVEVSKYLKKISAKEVQQYFKHEAMKPLPLLLNPSLTLVDIIVVCLEKFAEQPKLAEKLREEMEQVRLFSEEKEFDFGIYDSMQFLDACYREALRCKSTEAAPRYSENKLKLGKVEVPARTTIIIDFAGMRNNKIFGEKLEAFSPMRFLPGVDQGQTQDGKKTTLPKLNEYPLLPFSTGERRCPAMPISIRIFKLMLTYLVSHFDLEAKKNENNEISMTFTPKSQKSLQHTLAAST